MMNFALQTAIAFALALLFAAAGLYKLRNRAKFQAQLAEYRLLPPVLTPAASLMLAAIELALAPLLLLPATRAVAGYAAAALLIGYAIAIAVNLLRGRSHIDCGCGDSPQLLSEWLLLRNAVLAGGALLTTLSTAPTTFVWSDLMIAVPVFLVICVVYLIAEQLLENASALREWNELTD
jgi:hypothetical protein